MGQTGRVLGLEGGLGGLSGQMNAGKLDPALLRFSDFTWTEESGLFLNHTTLSVWFKFLKIFIWLCQIFAVTCGI